MKQILINLALAILLFFAPVKDALLCVAALVLIDLLFGLIAARRRGEPLTSSGFKRTIIKACVYEIVIMLGFVIQKYLIGDILELVKYLTMFIGLTELKSVLENLDDITGMPILKVLIDKISSKRDNE